MAAWRETREETGLTVEPGRVAFVLEPLKTCAPPKMTQNGPYVPSRQGSRDL